MSTATSPGRPGRLGAGGVRTASVPYLFLLPALLYLLVFWGYPALNALSLSLTDASLASSTARFVGLENYRRLLSDPVFWVSLRNSGILFAGSVVLEVLAGLAIALFLWKAGRGIRRLVLPAILVPWLFSELVTALMWQWVFQEPFGLLNALLREVGIQGPPWLGRPGTALCALVVASLWQGAGISALVLLAALQGIPGRLLDLAAMDGVARWRGLWHVILPQLQGVLLLDAMLVGIKSLGSFTLVFALTGGGPGHGTEILATYAYRLMFSRYEVGYASAAGTCLAAIFLLLVALVYLLQRFRPGPGLEGVR